MTGDSDSDGLENKPAWWRENAELRGYIQDIPAVETYQPPRFDDGTYTYEVVEPLEEQFGVELRFLAINPTYREEWEVRIADETAFSLGRRRDEYGNTVYTIDSGTFHERLRRMLESRSGDEE